MGKDAVAIIPARGGSKRIPRKNIKSFHGKPLIAYSIEIALQSKLFDRVIVSTDDKEIAKVAQEYGAEVPFMRDEALSGDFVGTAEVIEDVIKRLALKQNYSYLCTIYPTAPFLDAEYLHEGYKKLKESDDASIAFSVTSMPFPIQRTFAIKDGRCEMFFPEHFFSRSQDLEDAYQDAGQFYWRDLKKEAPKITFSSQSIPIVLPRYLVQDIDTQEDWKMAEVMYEVLRKRNLIS